MTIDNYFQLTFELVTEYISQIYPESNHYKVVGTTNENKLKQVELYHYDEKFLILSFTAISDVQSLVNLLNLDGRLDNALINWEWFDLDTIEFPIAGTSQLPRELVEKFQKKFRGVVDNEKVSSIFPSSTQSEKELQQQQQQQQQQQHVQKDDLKQEQQGQSQPIVEEHTDTESNYAKSPTPEEPYHPTNPVFTGGNPSASAPQSSQPRVQNAAFKRPSDMPDFEDEYQIRDPGQPTHDTLGQSSHLPPIGSDDLNPPGLPKDPTLKGYLDPLQGNSQGPLGSGGMHPDANHPIFHPGQGGESRGIGSGTSGYSGRKGVPPGARFDDPYSEENLDALGQGLPGGGLRGPGGGQPPPPGAPGFGGNFGNFGNFGPPGGGF